MPCSTCQHVRVIARDDAGAASLLECRAYPPEIGPARPDGTDGQWPRVAPADNCGLWLHWLNADLNEAPKNR